MKKQIFSLSLMLLMGGCANIYQSKISLPDVIDKSDFNKKTYNFQNFPIISLQKLHNPSNPIITIYIEGDGYAYVTKSRPSQNPTPRTAVALQLAKLDLSDNLLYFARPCQYAEQSDFMNRCDRKYWTTHRYAQDVISAYNSILDDISLNAPHTRFNLIGFSGGANIAGLLAGQRTDVESIRTVAGNLDNDFFTNYHKVSDMPYSLNMADDVTRLANIPQIHYRAAQDKFVPLPITQSYTNKLSHQNCTQTITVQNTTHLNGWDEQWSSFVTNIPTCR